MLVYQGAAAFEMWTGLAAPVDVMLQAAEKAMAARRTG
jgi:shikimate 5-dehydrogenase